MRCYGVRVEKPSEIQDALKGAFQSGKPAIIDVTTAHELPYGGDVIVEKGDWAWLPKR